MTKKVKTHIESINQKLEILKGKFKVNKIAIFGSTARGDNRKNSDIDIMVEFHEPVRFFAIVILDYVILMIVHYNCQINI